jgi:hypothetical protein
MKKTFPNIYKALSTMRVVTFYAIIEDGRIIATNGNILLVSDFSVFVDNPQWAEGQVFDKTLLQWMAKKDFKRLECTKCGIIAHKSGGKKEEKPYSGYWQAKEEAKRAIYLYPDEKYIGNYPDWQAVIPCDSQYASSRGFGKIACDVQLLSKAIDCFAFGKKQAILMFEFLKDDVNNPIRITPFYNNEYRPGKQCLYLAPHKIPD